MKLIKAKENPIIKPHPDHPWEDLVVCNPGHGMKMGHSIFYIVGQDMMKRISFI
jgi:hypothetical protein